jgi:hypothetical protein
LREILNALQYLRNMPRWLDMFRAKLGLALFNCFRTAVSVAQYPHRIYQEPCLSTRLASWHMTPVSQTRLWSVMALNESNSPW